MKKKILLSVFALSLALTSCNKSSANTPGLDFTKSYEDAALALVQAQKNYNTALESNDPAKIAEAKTALEAAQKKYESSKEGLVKGGGKVNNQFEKVFDLSTKSVQTGKISDSIKAIVEKPVTAASTVQDLKKAPQQIVNNTKEAVKQKLNSDVEQTKANVKAKVDKTKADLKAKGQAAEKKVNDKVNENVEKAQGKVDKFLNKHLGD